MSGILQSGPVTPGHVPVWTTDGVIQDGGITFSNSYATFVSTYLKADFNVANVDYQIPINLPIGYTRYRVDKILLSGATASLSTATCGVFTGALATGFAVVTGASAITVISSLFDTNNNMQSFTINDQNTLALSDTVLYFRVQNPNGSPGLGNITIIYQPLP